MRGQSVSEELFEQLAEANKRRIMWIARTYASRDSANDLYQEILFEIWKSLPGFEGRARVETWIYKVALRTASDFRRKAARRIDTAGEVREQDSPYVSASSDWQSESEILKEFIRSLEEPDRTLFMMYLDGGFSYADMAEVTGLKEPHLRMKISRIKKAYVDRYVRK